MAQWDWLDAARYLQGGVFADNLQSAFYGAPMPDEKRFEVLDKVYADGDLFWDSADIYMDSEDLLGKSKPL